jgi:hypothetical protein
MNTTSDIAARALPAVRRAVRAILEQNGELREQSALRNQLARKMVDVSMIAAGQVAEELRLRDGSPHAGPLFAEALEEFGEAARQAGGTIASLRDGIDFPTFVQGLVTGVFQAISRSSIEQVHAISELLSSVAQSAEEFSSTNITDEDARQWAVQRFNFLAREDGGELKLKSGEDLASHRADLRAALELSADSAVADGDLDALLRQVRLHLGRLRQRNLSTVVLMGLNRIVVDRGQLNASMDLRVDTRSLREAASRQRFDTRTDSGVSGGLMGLNWGISANVGNTVGYVKDDQSASSEELASQAGLRSSVNLVFHTEPIGMDQMASVELRRAILDKSPVPAENRTKGTILTNNRTAGISDLKDLKDAPNAPSLESLKKLWPDASKKEDGKSSDGKSGDEKSGGAEAAKK